MEGLTLKGVTQDWESKHYWEALPLEQETAVMNEKLFLNIRKTVANDSQKFGLIYQGQQQNFVCL